MSIVMNEYDWAEKMINGHDLGKKPRETLSRVSRYYYENRYTKREIRKQLDTFLTQCDPNVTLVKWSDMLDKIVKGVGKYPLIKVNEILISEPELERILTLEGKQLRRLAFTLLCVAKYWDEASATNNHWVNTPDKEIMQMANISTSIKRQSAMFNDLRSAGLIRFSKKIDNLNVQVLFIESGENAIRITDLRNLGYQYLKHYGEPYFECSACGITTKIAEPRRGRRQKYCSSCAAEIKTRQMVNSVMRSRKAMRE